MSIEVKNVVAGYKGYIEILHGISIHAEKSKITCIIGPNGAGKSTLLKTIYGFLRPKQGTIFFDGEDITGVAPHKLVKKGLVYIPQRRAVFPDLTVLENLEMGAWIFRKERKRVTESINKIYERFPILKMRARVHASRLSGGEQRMLEIGRALITSPKSLLVDEPTAGLAPKVAEEVYQKLAELAKEKITILFVDQNVKKAVTLSDYTYIIKVGQTVQEGPREEFDKKLTPLIKEWLV